MKRMIGLAGGAGLLALSLIGNGLHATGVSAQDGVVGHVYVNDNTARSNTIAGFDRHADGTLSSIPGSPFATGGAGAGMIVGSQGALQMTADGKFLLAVNPGSNNISVLAIGEDGALAAQGDPVDSGGTSPISVAVHDDLVYVVNAGDGKSGANYSGFRLDDAGMLTAIDGSTVDVSATSSPGQILIDPNGTHVVGIEVGPDAGPSAIDSFTVNDDGTLAAAPGSPFAAQATGPFGSAFSPTEPNMLYVSIAHAGPNHGSVSAYTVADDGTLTAVEGSPFPNAQTASCWLEISSDGKFVFTVNTAVPSLSSYQVEADGSLTLLHSTVFNNPTGLRPFDVRISPDGGFLYVVDAGTATVSAFTVTGGDLSEISASPVALPAGATPFGIVVS